MGLLERIAEDRNLAAETRVIAGVPWRLRPWDNPFVRFDSGGPAHPSRSFYGTDEALRLTPVYAAVRLIAEYISSLPLKLYIKDTSGKQRRYTGPSMFDDPAPLTNVMDWLYECLTSLLLQGNAWGFVLGRDGYGYPTQIAWQPPEMVTVIDDDIQPFNPLRSKVYFYGRLMNREEYFHIKAFALPGRTEGISPMRAFALTILNGLEATRYGTDWFRAGGFPPGTFKNNEIEIDSTQSAEIRQLLNASIRRREPLVYGRDWDYHPVTVPPSEAQFIQAMQLNATQIAAVYGLPPERIGGTRSDSLTYANVEQSAIQVIEALRPWLVRLETAFFRILPVNRYARFNADALLKTDLATRTNIWNVQRDMGLRTIDEIRETEDLEPLPHGIGAESMGQELIEQLVRAGAVPALPTSLLPALTLSQDLILPILKQLQAEGLTKPDAGPSVPGPEDYVAGKMVQAEGKSASGPEYVGPWVDDGGPAGDLHCYIDAAREAMGAPDDVDPPASWIRAAVTLGEQLFGIEERDPRQPALSAAQVTALVAVLRVNPPDERHSGFTALAALNGHNGRH